MLPETQVGHAALNQLAYFAIQKKREIRVTMDMNNAAEFEKRCEEYTKTFRNLVIKFFKVSRFVNTLHKWVLWPDETAF